MMELEIDFSLGQFELTLEDFNNTLISLEIPVSQFTGPGTGNDVTCNCEWQNTNW